MPSMSDLIFFLLAALAIGSAAVVALSKNIIYSTLALLGTFLGVGGMYILLSADFLAATQILVYVGGTLTLILFAVMLTARIEEQKVSNPHRSLPTGIALTVVVLLILGKLAHTATSWTATEQGQSPSTAKLGHAFLSSYLLPFEIASVVLLGAMIGSVLLARRAVKQQGDE